MDGKLNVIKPHEGDQENIHGVDFYKITPLKSLGFGCIMYAPHNYEPLAQEIVFNYSSVLKPFTNVLFKIFLSLLAIIFIVATTITLFEGKLIHVEEENKKLESTVKERTKELETEKNRSERLLLNILPKKIATELTAHPDSTIAGIEKIKTIGDSYMAAAGLSPEGDNEGAGQMIRFAQGLLEDVRAFNEASPVKLEIRLGINSGSLVAGVIGKTKFIYDIWGDTVNVASRMESTGVPMKIHVTENTKAQTSDLFQYSENTEIDVKGKGMMKTYFL